MDIDGAGIPGSGVQDMDGLLRAMVLGGLHDSEREKNMNGEST